MKNLTHLVSKGHQFLVDDEHPFLITKEDVGRIARIGEVAYALLTKTQDGLHAGAPSIEEVLAQGGTERHMPLQLLHPDRYPVLIRIDLMVDTKGNWMIAEIDPSNKHGTGFSMAIRNESNAGERQKLLTLLGQHVTGDTAIILGRKESFFHKEQSYFADLLSKQTGHKVRALASEHVVKKLKPHELILDFPSCCAPEAHELLVHEWTERPERFINPPRHLLGSKALMTLPFEHCEWLTAHGMEDSVLRELQQCIPATYLGPFVSKETYSSGAKGVSFGSGKAAVFQRFVAQRAFEFDGAQQFIRMACFYVGPQLAELAVSACSQLPVHGGDATVNYHVNLA